MTGIWQFLTDPASWSGPDGIGARLGEHVLYSVIALLIAALIAIPIGAAIGHTGRGVGLAAGVANALRAIPALGLLTLLVLWGLNLVQGQSVIPARWGLVVPSITVLVVLGVPPILTNTYAGIQAVDPAVRDAARGMGMSGRRVLLGIELPLAIPLIMAGIRSAFLQIVSTATILAVVVTMGGLGRYILDGPKAPVNGYGIMAGGALLVALVALVGDLVLTALGRWWTPAGVRAERPRFRPRASGEPVGQDLRTIRHRSRRN